MKRVALAIGVVFSGTLATTAEYDPDGPLPTLQREAAMLMSASPMATAKARPVRQRPDRLVAMVNRLADQIGVPRAVAALHVDRESGWNARARNPRSTATGLLQLIHGSHAAIVGERLSRAEHFHRAADPEANAKAGLAHIRACMDFMPSASAERLWRKCHVGGHGNVGGSIERAREHYARAFGGASYGWLALGTTAVPWAQEKQGG